MYKIEANISKSKRIDVTDEHLQTIKKYALLKDLIDSNGIIDEGVLDKLRLNVRSLLEAGGSDDKQLLDLCLDVVYHKYMKAYGLHKLIMLYLDWNDKQQAEATQDSQD